jgi:hypothetical protein
MPTVRNFRKIRCAPYLTDWANRYPRTNICLARYSQLRWMQVIVPDQRTAQQRHRADRTKLIEIIREIMREVQKEARKEASKVKERAPAF